jgi:hypothetical protein
LYGLHTNLFLIKTGTNVLQKTGVSKRIRKSGSPEPKGYSHIKNIYGAVLVLYG